MAKKTAFKNHRNAKNHPITKGRGMGTGKGKPKTFETPEELFDWFKQYVQWTVDNPLMYHHEGAKYRKNRAVTFNGFEVYLHEQGVIWDLAPYEQNRQNRYDSYVPIIRAIKKFCTESIITGALTGIFNANLAARLEGLKEHVDTTSGGEPMAAPTINVYAKTPKLSSSEDEVN